MTTPNERPGPGPQLQPAADRDQRFDQAMRALHARAVDQVTPQTRARLRTIRSEAAAAPVRRSGVLGWALASGGVAAFALALGLQFVGGNGGAPAVPESAPAVASAAAVDAVYDPDTAVAALDENPDLYLWLASNGDALPNPSE
ncbi:hypothetical protein GLA29479_3591 [Lysobacter antibioticus]|uniref:hypothetical protein n=1 Tax=Lysobacter antibioticus TaxID=84531 RepID=UPI000722464A|nr:hypothetical protein [Lysobacter antibioticus]ALN64444.1 hypothetical protein GLA29479_3591 [Lysobacter antibioticus]